jgi:hypothetical protein
VTRDAYKIWLENMKERNYKAYLNQVRGNIKNNVRGTGYDTVDLIQSATQK